MQPDRQESLQERGLLSSNSEQAVIVSGSILVIAKDAGSVWRCEEDIGLLFSSLLAHSDFCPCVLVGEHAKPEQASQIRFCMLSLSCCILPAQQASRIT
jgi:hypothetical protein